MSIVLLNFKTESEWLAERKKDVTSTEIGSLFGLGYKTRLQLWHEKNGSVDLDFEENDFTKWGQRLQVPVAMGICEDEGWQGFDLTGYYYRDTELRIGCSMDVRAVCPTLGNGLMEIKVAEKFTEDAGWTDFAAPLAYEFQIQTQFHLPAKKGDPFEWGGIFALGSRQKVKKYMRHYDAELGKIIDEEVFKFWESIKAGDPPPPNYAADDELLEKIGPKVRAGETRNLSLDQRAVALAAEYHEIAQKIKSIRKEITPLENKKKAIQSEIKSLIKDAETAVIGDFIVRRPEVTVEEKVEYGGTYRRFDLKPKKGK